MKIPNISPNRVIAIGTAIGIFASASSFIYKVNPGERAIVFNKFGGRGIGSQVMREGYHFMIPVVQEIIKYDIKIQPFDFFSFTSTKDMQKVSIKIKIFFKCAQKTDGKVHSKDPLGPEQRLCQQDSASDRQRSAQNSHGSIRRRTPSQEQRKDIEGDQRCPCELIRQKEPKTITFSSKTSRFMKYRSCLSLLLQSSESK